MLPSSPTLHHPPRLSTHHCPCIRFFSSFLLFFFFCVFCFVDAPWMLLSGGSWVVGCPARAPLGHECACMQVPDYFALVTRALIVLEGIAVTGDPSFDLFQASYPYASRKAIDSFGLEELVGAYGAGNAATST